MILPAFTTSEHQMMFLDFHVETNMLMLLGEFAKTFLYIVA